jgi:hypothetical protein
LSGEPGDADTKDNTKEKRKENLAIEIDKLDQRIDSATENGLFQGQPETAREKIIQSLQDTRGNLDKGQYLECEKNKSVTWGLYCDALNSKTRSWRLFNLHAIHIWIYLIAVLVAIFSIYYFGLLNCPVESATSESSNKNVSQLMNANSGEPKAGVQSSIGNSSNTSTSGEQCYLNKVFGKDVIGFYAVTWGTIGAVLRGLWYLKDKTSSKLYRNAWNIYFLSVPFIGGILGAIVYFIIIAGLISVSATNVNIQHAIPVIVFAALAGFNWQWAVDLFRKLGDSLSPPPSVEKKESIK